MDILEDLTNDHRLISRLLGAFEQFLSDSEPSRNLDLVELNRFTVFFREFVELCHHEREERVLLPALEGLGFARDGAPIAHIREEHERERTLLLELRRTAVQLHTPADVERARILKVGHDLVAFERAHMKKENELLYPSVAKELAGRSLSDLGRALGERAGRWSDLVEQKWLRSLADELIRDHAPASSGAEAG